MSSGSYNLRTLELIILLTAVGLVGAILGQDLASAAAVDGESSWQLQRTRKVIDRWIELRAGGDSMTRALLQAYDYMPKMLYQVLGALTWLIFAREVPDYATLEQLMIRQTLAFMLVGLVAVYAACRVAASRWASLVAFVVTAGSAYVVLYADYPRANVPANALSWIGLGVYLWSKSKVEKNVEAWGALFSGCCLGLAIPIHYTTIYIVAGVGLAEIALLWFRRDLRTFARNSISLVLPGILIVTALEGFYWYAVNRFPEERDLVSGQLFSALPYSYFGGLQTALSNIAQASTEKHLPVDPLFFPRALVANFGWIVPCFIFVGCAGAVGMIHRGRAQDSQRDLAVSIVSVAAASLIVSLEGNQSVRKLIVYLPAWMTLFAFGLDTVTRVVASLLQGLQRKAALVIVFGGLAAIWAFDNLPRDVRVFEARRDAGKMRDYLAEHGIHSVLVMPLVVETPMAPQEINLRESTKRDRDTAQYVVVNRLIRGLHGDGIIECLRAAESIISFTNIASLPLFRLEYPLRREFMDLDDRLTNSRHLFLWPDVRDCLEPRLRERGFIVRND
jgi:hypothetical protein